MTEDAASPPVPDHDAPSPPTFDALPLSPETRGTLERMGYTHPTPVQRAVFEPATGGRDLVVQARTGTGKTTAFGLPIVEHGVRRSVKAVQALCLCPTRELALQVSNELSRLGEGRGVSLVAVYGGAPMGRQIDALAGGAQVVVGTPGRVLDHLRRGTLDPSAVRLLVLDEADEMLSMGFERELHAILDVLPKERQTLLFSATVPPDIERIARERL
ncbi:MAG TPA: DEAD/DEAH box helicase, partial [Polyangiaceae bacterium]|nr:DEAD/DEAH box helicase [Polyangiaceae bacterium]